MHDVETYLRSGRRRVHGWLHPYSAQLIVDLAAAQRKLGISGGLGEIGVHMGKLFLCLHLSRAAGEKTLPSTSSAISTSIWTVPAPATGSASCKTWSAGPAASTI